ncbi:Similar to Sspo: SCO-spondin (Mus musculus), partial [Cotesia congregata]
GYNFKINDSNLIGTNYFVTFFFVKDINEVPRDGGWSEWGPWICSASCNGGVGKRKRVCNNPEPNIKGEPCMGPSEMTGTCNTNLCGDITRDTITLINRRKKNSHLALVVKEGQPVTIPCDSDIVAKVEKESPRSEIQWSHDGIFK